MKVLLINPGGLPVPDVKGGAVQSLITNLIRQNEKEDLLELYSITPFDNDAFIESKKYTNTTFVFVNIPKLVKYLDAFLYYCASKISSHPQSFGRVIKSLFYLHGLKKNLLINDYDKIIFEHNNILLFVLKNRHVYKKYKNKYILHLHNDIRTIKPIIPLINKCPEIWTVSEYLKNSIVCDTQFNINPQTVKVFYNAIDESKFNSNNTLKQKYGFLKYLDNNKKIILFAGRLNKEKGVEQTLEIFDKLDHTKYQLIIVGDVFYSVKTSDKFSGFNKYKNLIKQGNIILTGYIKYDDMPSIYNLADIVLLPSMWNEPAGLTMLEAVFCQKKLITTNSGGIPEYVRECSIIVNRDCVVDESIKAIKMIDSMDFEYDTVRKKFSIEKYYSRFIALLKKEISYEKSSIN